MKKSILNSFNDTFRIFILCLTIGLSFSIVLSSCSDDDDDPEPDPTPTNTIAQVVAAESDFSSLLAALQKAELVSTFEGTTEYTVFAPTNTAFSAFLVEQGVTLEELTKEQLTEILTYHVVSGDRKSSTFTDGATIPTLNSGESLSISVNGNAIMVNDANVTAADTDTKNGVIHTIDKVLVPSDFTLEPETPSIVGIATENPDFSILVEALQKADLVSTLDGTTAYTVFAPTNAAFEALFTELGVDGIADIDVATLTPILLYHVANGTLTSSQINAGTLATLNTDASIEVTVDGSTITLNEDTQVTQADISASNGVVHVINKVLVPPTEETNTIADIVTADTNFSILLQALQAANLTSAVANADANLTVFAPTNAAFEAFIAANADINSTEDLLNSPNLSNILLYHVLGTKQMAADLSQSPFYVSTLSPATFEGRTDETVSLLVDGTDGVKLNGTQNISVTQADMDADNGVIHVIDNVLMPPNVVELAQQNGGFTELVAAVLRADLATTVATANPITVFAPTNAAFDSLYIALGINGIDEIDVPTLTGILQHHVVSENLAASDLSDAQTITTLNGDVEVSIAEGVVTLVGANSSAKVVLTDVQGTNGIVHVIDMVLLP
ncbi:fasciclin domain-containing protein [Bernardetia sp. Wsw4-3y2]|uniref:fasciclin domain-containing protein n=1 Tax=Bernardetia sp. Wsw4-3y2 TaxID=3127471 RepID=UPI0030D5EB5C